MTAEDRLFIWESLKNNFNELEFFEDSHTYFVAGKRFPSVTGIINKFTDEFNTDLEAERYAKKNNFDKDDVIHGWDGEGLLGTTKGSRVHLFGEDYAKWKYFGIGDKPRVTCKQCLGVIQFWNELPLYIVPVALEIQMYSKKYGYCGTADILCYDTLNNKFILYDYKTNKKIFDERNNWTKHLKYIDSKFDLIQDSFGKYTLQFSFYQILLEDIGVEVSHRNIVWLNDNGEKLYQTYRTPDVTQNIRAWLEEFGVN